MEALRKETTFSRRVKEQLKACNVTQKQLCNDLHIQEGSFSRYMQEGRTPRADLLANIACYLHTTSDYLLGYDENIINSFRLLAKSPELFTKEQSSELKEILDEINKSQGY